MSNNSFVGNNKIPEKVLVIPTIDIVVLPKMVIPLLISDESIITKINQNRAEHSHILLVGVKQEPQPTNNGPIAITKKDLYSVGTISKIIKIVDINDNNIKILIQGTSRTHVNIQDHEQGCLIATYKPYDFTDNISDETRANILTRIQKIIEKYENANPNLGADFQFIINQLKDTDRLVDFLVSRIGLSAQDNQKLLEQQSSQDLLNLTVDYFENFAEKTSISESVKNSAKNSINKSQREYYLREQLRAIKKELGEPEESEIESLRISIDASNMTQEARDESLRQLRRLEKMSPDSLESVVIRNHLEWLINLPWGKYISDQEVDIKKAHEILDEQHFGLEDVKDKILDYLSIKHFKSKFNAQILCLAGPPGVGKTSIGKSIAKALGRNFARISLGGVHDESEIRGHRRTYVGSLPGRIIQSIKKAGSCDPVLVIDEIDKLGNSGRGDPASAMLEVLDPEQNCSFYDNYLGVPFDISSVMFIATCNDISAIPGPLRDRMDIVQLSGYTHNEKIKIAQNFLLPRIVKNVGLEDKGIELNNQTISKLIHDYTSESGVRELERIIRKACCKFARSLIEKKQNLEFSDQTLHKYLGPAIIHKNSANRQHKIGVTNGLAWTSVGGELLQVEAILMPGKGRLTLTGKLGEVMKESAQAAISYIRSNAQKYGINQNIFENNDLHVHLPAGAIPKDGPSAGVTLVSSILSAFTNRPIDSTCAMTGEVNLQGLVLPIGGLREKLLAAQQNDLQCVIVPEANKFEVEENPNFKLENLELCYVKTIDEIISRVLLG